MKGWGTHSVTYVAGMRVVGSSTCGECSHVGVVWSKAAGMAAETLSGLLKTLEDRRGALLAGGHQVVLRHCLQPHLSTAFGWLRLCRCNVFPPSSRLTHCRLPRGPQSGSHNTESARALASVDAEMLS